MIAIVDYKAGNLTSVRLAFDALGVASEITRDPAVIAAADRVVFPGVGAAGASMEHLRSLGLEAPVRAAVASGRPFLGICLGMQILLDESEENGDTPCLGVIPGRVQRFRPTSRHDKVPQIGWNGVDFVQTHPVFAGIESGSEFYFVHSYYATPVDQAHWLATTDYAGAHFASIVGRGNVVATQFHPERSGRIGLRLLENFSRWTV